jgi:putative transposase
VTKRANVFGNRPGTPLWQRNYYEHIVRDEDDLFRIRMYIRSNPLKWALDEKNPESA